MPGIWASLPYHPSISWPIDGVFRIDFVISWRPEIPAFLTAFPWPSMVILIMGVAHTKAFVLHLTSPAASKRHKRRIATYPLLTTRGFHQRRFGIATEATMLAGNRLGFHAVVRHRVAFSGAVAPPSSLVSLEGCITPPIVLSYGIIFISTSTPHGLGHRVTEHT